MRVSHDPRLSSYEIIMVVRLLLSYDVKVDQMQDYYRFMLGKYVPMMQRLGLEMSDAWHTAYGDQPIRLIGFVCRDEDELHTILSEDTWERLNDELVKYVTDFSYKVVPYREGFQY